MMKQSGVFKKLFFGFAIFFVMLTQGWADVENNDNCAQAELIAAMNNKSGNYNTTMNGTVQNGDDDYYYFTIPQNGTLSINYTSDPNTRLRIQAGGTCSSSMNQVLGSGTSYNGTLSISAGQTVYIHINRRNNSPTYSLGLSFAPVAPTISSVSAGNVGSTTATINGTPSADGTMYYVVTTSATAPSVAMVKAGKDADNNDAPFSGSSAVTASTAKSFNLTGLSGSTSYYGYLVMTDTGNGLDTTSVYSTGVFTTGKANNIRSFGVAYQTNDFGNIKIIGNSVMVGGANNACPANDIRNNSINAVYANIDAANTYNSSSATLSIPSGATVKWAGLYWQGYAPDYNSTMKNVKFKAPGMSAYQPLTSGDAKFNWVYFATDRYYFQGAVDVTDYVKNAGSGDYIVGNIATQIGQPNGGSFGAWSLIVVYQDLSEPKTLRNLTVFDGYQAISSSDASKPDVYTTLAIPLSGFLTPPRDSVSSTVYMFVGEGDLGATGDSVSMTNKDGATFYLADTKNPWNDLMNSSVTDSGAYVLDRNPYCQNTIGIDIDSFNVGTSGLGIIGNNQTSTTATFTSAGDGYFPGAVAFATQIYQPLIHITKQANTSGTLQQGANISYVATMKNSGEEAASNIKVYDDFTANQMKTTDGDLTNPAVYLSDIIDRNATKILKTIRLTDINGTVFNHCPVGVTGAGCVYSDADCGVDYSGDPETTATKIWCNIPRLDINATTIMTFNLDIAADAASKTQDQNINVSNVMNATYYNALTGEAIAIPAESNSAEAGQVYGKASSFDAWENGLTKDTARIYTKLHNTLFSLNVGAANVFNGAVCAAVTDSGDNVLTGGDYQCKDFTIASMPFSWTVTKADKKAKIKIKSKAGALANTVNLANPNWTGWTGEYSSDSFAIRPQYLSVSTTPAPLIVQKAGDNTNKIDINTTTPGYDQSLANLTLNISKWLKIDGSDLGSTPPVVTGLTLSGSFNFATGNASDATFVFGDVGRFKVDVNDTQWAASSGDITNADCLTTSANYTAANTLIDGKYGCYVMLNPQSGIDLRFIPDHFNVTGGAITNANDGSFTYFSSDLAVQAATIPMTITAVNKTEVTTQNYSNGLYARTINNIPEVNATGYTKVDQSPTVNFVNGVKDMTGSNAFKFNFQRSVNAYLNPLTVDSSKISNLTITDTDGVAGALTVSGSAVFLYGKVSMPNAMVDYSASGIDIRAFAQVYATSSASLPSGSTWTQAPGSTNWWINSLDSASSMDEVYVRKSDTLALSNEVGSITSPATVVAGTATMKLTPTNVDQKLKIHLDVPSYLWYSPTGVTYDFAAGSDCSKHPCAWVDVFATTTSDWFGAGEKKDDKAIKAVPKGKRKPKVNW